MTVLDAMKNKQPFVATYDKIQGYIQDKTRSLIFEFNHLPPEKYERSQEILKLLFGTWNKDVHINQPFYCNYGCNIHAEGFLFVNFNCTFLDNAAITFGKNCLIAPGVVISTISHGIHPDQRLMFDNAKPVTLKDNVWVGANSTILGGVTIGQNSIIGAGSVVTKNIPDNVIAVGKPCKVLRPITQEDKIEPDKFDSI